MYDLEKTLFVSDLDGTLLKSDGTLAKETAEVVAKLVAKGVKFSFATARSYHTAMQVAGGLAVEIPMILHNGVFIRDSRTGKYLCRNLLPEPEYVRRVIEENGLEPFVYSVNGEVQKYRYHKGLLTPEAAAYQATRRNDPRDEPLPDNGDLWVGNIFYVMCIDNGDGARRAHEALRYKYSCLYAADYYSGDKWFEVYSPKASKAQAVLQLRDILGCDKVVVFGDGANDVSMFEAADEAYAVEGAVEALKAKATGVIGSNDDGAVVRWIEENVLRVL
ncbi:MAG: HAD family hydrolase [Clostridia bacterium]|nr:HAD family hydrolase [Clostridia bacterium]